MPQSRDKKLSKRAQKRLAGGATGVDPVSNLRPLSMSTPMHTWPVHECVVPQRWSQPGELIQMVVTRRSDAAEFASAIILVDLGCLGVKNAHTMRFTTESEYQEWLETMPVVGELERISLDLAAKIVRTAIDYAASLGFRPHRDYALASPFLRGAHPELAEENVPTGLDGRPYFISGPYDNVRKIIAQLDRKVGAGNYTMMVGGSLGDFPLDEFVILDDAEALPEVGKREPGFGTPGIDDATQRDNNQPET